MEARFLTIQDPGPIIIPRRLHTMEDTRDLEAIKVILEEAIQAEEDTLEGRIKVEWLQRGAEIKMDQRRRFSLLWSIMFWLINCDFSLIKLKKRLIEPRFRLKKSQLRWINLENK